MYQHEKIDRNKWNGLKQSTFEKLETSKDRFLYMHTKVDDQNIQIIQEFMYFNYEDITTSQLRNIYSLVLDIDKSEPSQLSLKRVKLAYIAGRTDKKKIGLHNLLTLLDSLFESVKNDTEKLKGVKTFTEALVAYHKYFDSLKNQPKRY